MTAADRLDVEIGMDELAAFLADVPRWVLQLQASGRSPRAVSDLAHLALAGRLALLAAEAPALARAGLIASDGAALLH